jgi:hypothetical protein
MNALAFFRHPACGALALFCAGFLPCPAQTDPAGGVDVAPRVVSLEGELALDSEVKVRIAGLAAWAAKHDVNKIVPMINGRAIHGNRPTEVHLAAEHLHFDLAITPENRAVWNALLGEPAGFFKKVEFSVGPDGESPFATVFTETSGAPLTVISPVYGWISIAVVVATLVALIVLARRTSIVRDSGPDLGSGRLRPYNLGRTQMAFWFFLMFTSYIVIWLITGALDTITASLLGLMGISAGTALSEVLIDDNKDTAAAAKLQSATVRKQALEQTVAGLQAQLAALAAKAAPSADDAAVRDNLTRQLLDQRTQLNQAAQDVGAATDATADDGASHGFIRDILSDGHSWSFHRFQIFAWTILLGGVFVAGVYNNLTMPEFSATLLGLMGISSGTYIGFKFPEQR